MVNLGAIAKGTKFKACLETWYSGLDPEHNRWKGGAMLEVLPSMKLRSQDGRIDGGVRRCNVGVDGIRTRLKLWEW